MRQRGFTLLEAMIALLILAGSLAILMQVQASSLAKAARARDMSVASLLARGKMIDIEQEIFDDGFTQGEQVEKGDFEEEGYPDIKWRSRIAEVDLDIGLLEDLCGTEEDAGVDGSEGCAGMLGSIGGLVEPVTQNIANSVRMVELEIEWPEGRYKNGFSVRTLLTRDGFTFAGGTPDPPDDPNNNANSNGTPTPAPTPTPGPSGIQSPAVDR
ncbi:MAG: type II secretion system protein [Myxococcota bacterium]